MKYPMEERLVWFRNELTPIKEARVMVMSPTAQYGLNVFEGIPCYWNGDTRKMYAFRLEDHYSRLLRSAELLQINCGYSMEQMKQALEQVIRANAFEENITVRQTLIVDDFGSWRSSSPTEMYVIPTPRRYNDKEYTRKGLKICVSSWRRISDNSLSPRIKCGANYINSRMGQLEAVRNGYDTCIFLNSSEKISEGPGSCFFMIKNGRLITPALTDSVLESITRDSVIKIARDIGLEVTERSIDRTELYTADEAFLCGSAMEITPVISIDGFNIPGEEGITRRLHDIYLEAAYHKNERYAHWTTSV